MDEKTLEQAWNEHQVQQVRVFGISRTGHEEVTCTCGRLFTDKEEQYSHQSWHAWEWMRANQFGDPLYWLKPGTSCTRCGAVVGLPDIHRKVCRDG